MKPGSRLIVPMNKAGEGSEDPTWCEVSQAAGPLPKHPLRTCLHFYMEMAWHGPSAPPPQVLAL